MREPIIAPIARMAVQSAHFLVDPSTMTRKIYIVCLQVSRVEPGLEKKKEKFWMHRRNSGVTKVVTGFLYKTLSSASLGSLVSAVAASWQDTPAAVN